MRALKVKLQKDTDLNNISINNVVCAIDNRRCRHSNQYLRPEGGLYSYKDYVNYLVKRFKYEKVDVLLNDKVVFSWNKK